MFDTHCHLDSFLNLNNLNLSFPHLAVSTESSSWIPLIKLSESNSNVIPAIGIHPWFVNDAKETELDKLSNLLAKSSYICIGEIGLDYLPKHQDSIDRQRFYFESQLLLAAQYKRSLSLHIVKAHNDAINLLSDLDVCGSIHGLGASPELAQRYLDLGFKIGVNAVSVRENARRYHQMIKYCGIENLVLETDYPNINLPNCSQPTLYDIYLVAEHVATLLNLPVSTVIEITDDNAQQLFIE